MAGLAYEVRGGFCADFEGGIRHWNIHRYVLVVLMSIIMQALLSPAVAGASSSVPGTLGEQAKIDQNGSFNLAQFTLCVGGLRTRGNLRASRNPMFRVRSLFGRVGVQAEGPVWTPIFLTELSARSGTT